MQRDDAGGISRRAATSQLADLAPELIERVLSFITSARDLAAANAASRLFRGPPVERVLRARARARGHAHALPSALPVGVCTWTEELFARERVLELSRAHAHSLGAGGVGTGCLNISVFLDNDGQVYTCGEQREHRMGQWRSEVPRGLGQPDGPGARVLVPTPVASLAGVRAISVAASTSEIIALGETGEAYERARVNDAECFARLDALATESVVGIAAGSASAFAHTAAGAVYSWGHSNWHGELGRGDLRVPTSWRTPARIRALEGVRIGAVAAGGRHALMLSTCGAVYSCGQGRYGQLGHGDDSEPVVGAVPGPKRIEALARVRVVHVTAGGLHSLVVDSNGGVYSFGANQFGQLGHGDEVERTTPTRIDAMRGITVARCAAGWSCTALICADGGLYVAGENTHGQLGLGHTEHCARPTLLFDPRYTPVRHCSMSSSHSLFALVDGTVFSCGLRNGGLGRNVSGVPKKRKPQSEPGLVFGLRLL